MHANACSMHSVKVGVYEDLCCFWRSRGIGSSLVSDLLRDGHNVVNISRNESEENMPIYPTIRLDVLEKEWPSLPDLTGDSWLGILSWQHRLKTSTTG